MLQVYLAALHDGAATPSVLYSYAIFAYNRLHDENLALRLVREAADSAGSDPQYRLNLVNFRSTSEIARKPPSNSLC